MPTLLITGANRGIGLEFTRQYAHEGWKIYACCRNPGSADELRAIADSSNGQVSIHRLDVGDFAQIDDLAREIGSTAIDVLINNAGIYPDSTAGKLTNSDYEAWLKAFRINSMAPMKLAQTFSALVAKSQQRKIINITSKMGSIEDNTSGGSYLYRSSKTALNMVVKSLSIDLAHFGISTIVLHPGWVQTDMGGPNALITAEQSVSGMRRVIEKLNLATSGRFYAYDGKEIPW